MNINIKGLVVKDHHLENVQVPVGLDPRVEIGRCRPD